jgi:predicted NBD/HSP70 family sugar kinase
MTPRKPANPVTPKSVLVVDVGGSNIKLMRSGSTDRIKFCSGSLFTPRQLMAGVRKYAAHWEYDAVSLGLPIPIVYDRPVREPNNLGRGWIKFDYQSAFGKPCKLINDAAMQALGSYEGGRMLFIGLGTGLGSAMILDNVVIPLELGELSYSPQRTFEGMLGREGRKRLGQKRWEEALDRIVGILQNAFVTDYIILGGGNARRVEHLPKGVRLGDNRNAFLGGLRLWGLSPGGAETEAHAFTVR